MARANLERTIRKFAKLAENHMQANVGMRAKDPRGRTKEKEKEKGKLTKKERIPRENQSKEKLRMKSAVYVANSTLSKTAGTIEKIKIPGQKKVGKATGHQP